MGDNIERLYGLREDSEDSVALAGMERVSGYTRVSSLGKTVHVDAYTRSPGKMSSEELISEIRDLAGSQPINRGFENAQRKNRLAQLTSELRSRGDKPSASSTMDRLEDLGLQTSPHARTSERDRWAAIDERNSLVKSLMSGPSDPAIHEEAVARMQSAAYPQAIHADLAVANMDEDDRDAAVALLSSLGERAPYERRHAVERAVAEILMGEDAPYSPNPILDALMGSLRRYVDQRVTLSSTDEEEDFVRLAGLTKVKAYLRKGKDGKTVAVSSYTRSVRRMSFAELQDEFKSLQGKSDNQSKNRLQQIVGEIRFRGFEPGEEWDDEKGQKATARLRERTANDYSMRKASWETEIALKNRKKD